jgi:pseurotin biosynthesis cytochrome P450 monooxygenase
MLHSVMSIAVNQNYEPHMDLESKYTLQDLLETPQDFDNHLGRYAFGVLFRSGLGVKTHTIKDEVVQDILNTNDFAVNCFRPDKYLCNLFSWTLHLPAALSSECSFLTTKHQELCTRIRRSQDDMRSKMAHGKAPECLQQYFIDNQTDYGLSDLEGGGVFETILGAGTRSPHNTLLVFLALMLKYPGWLEKIQEEIDQVVGPNRLPTFADMPHLPTVRAVVKETVRYRSVYTDVGVPHKLRQDDIYEGYFFPVGTLFHANLRYTKRPLLCFPVTPFPLCLGLWDIVRGPWHIVLGRFGRRSDDRRT